jgi:hypothetical protein
LPLSSEPLKAERRGAVNRFLNIIKENEGESKNTVIALGQYTLGAKKSTIYDYYHTLLGVGKVVEEWPQVWTAKTYNERIQQKLVREAEEEKRLTAVVSLDAFDTKGEGT